MSPIAISRSMLVNQGLSAVTEMARVPDNVDAAPISSVDAVASFKRLVTDSISVVDVDLAAAIAAFNSPLDLATYFINAKYAELGGSSGMLGTTTSAVVSSPGGAGFLRTFQHGAIYFHPQVGAHELHGPVRVRWQELGGEKGFLGFPTSDVTPGADVRSEGVFAHFQGGSIYWAPLPRVSGVLTETVASGALTTTVLAPAAGSSSPPIAAASTIVPGAIAAATLPVSVTSTVTTRPPAAAVTGTPGATRVDTLVSSGIDVGIVKPAVESSAGAFEVHGAIREKYLALGAESSILGYPRTDETVTPDGIGRYNHFQGGSIYWTPATYAHEVHGLIRDRWASQGWERNPQLGYPISDEMIPDPRIGHRRPEVQKKPIVALPIDVIKLPAEAALAGFPSTVVNTPVTPVRVRETTVKPTGPTTTAATTSATTVLPVAGSALGKLSERTDAVIAPEILTIDPSLVGLLINTPASTAATRSVNRFSDFENGVLFWFRGATSASTLTPLASFSDGTSVSYSGGDIATTAIAKIGRAAFEGGNARVSSVNFVGTTAYSFDGAQTHNRRHRVQVVVAGNEVFPVTATVELQVEVWFDASKRQIVLTPTDWTLMQASSGSFAESVRAGLRGRLDPILWTSYELMTLPDTDGGSPIAVISVKTLGNGAVAVFIEPHRNPVLGTISGVATEVLAGVVLSQPN